jgi:ribosomal protein S18 acetylase RimI-like enzyme
MVYVNIRKATIEDMKDIHDLVVELAVYEKSPEEVYTDQDEYKQDFENGLFNCLVAEDNGKILGIAIYYMAYSTWKGKMMYLDDLVIRKEYRRLGIGGMLFQAFLTESKAVGCRLVKWQVLDWNELALNFYSRFDAVIEKDWWNGKIVFNAKV